MTSSIETEPGDPLVGQALGGKYTLERMIGRGGMGHVYLASSSEGGNERRVVVKMIAPPLAQQPQAMARFEREAKRLDGLRHSNIVEMYDYGREGGRAYIVMEYVDGELLSDYMARKGRLTLAEFVPIAAQILKGVGHAHSRDLMIRDIKPANVMLCERKGRANFVKIIDFGLAKMLEGDEDITKQHFIGTSGYLSPEQIKGLDIDLRVDVYAMGVLFYQLLSGRMPFEAENDTTLLYKHVHDFPTPLSEVLPEGHEVPDELVHLIHDCLEKDPDQRPRDANEIVERLIDCVPMSMFRLPPVGQDPSLSASDTGAVSALSTAALAAPTGETGAYLKADAGSAPGISNAALTRPSTGEGSLASASQATLAEPAPSKRKLGPIIGIVAGVAAAAAIAVVVMGGKDEPVAEDEAEVGAQEPELDVAAELAEAESLVSAGDFDGAAKKLAGIRGQDPSLAGQIGRLDHEIEVGKLLATAKELDEAGKTEAAIAAYEDVIEVDGSNSEARTRLAELRNAGKKTADVTISSEPVADLHIDGSPAGTTPYDDALPLGKHTLRITAEGYEDWEKEVEIKAGKNLPIKVQLSPAEDEDGGTSKKKRVRPKSTTKPAATKTDTEPEPKPEPKPETKPKQDEKKSDNPFLPTKKKKSNGPFLPTQK